ncbi:MAG: hypothetical protein HYZ54_08130 [Ignavibacteriae bacterium]|nr:hypothetical protein [Ignavibacteriota bacterium]
MERNVSKDREFQRRFNAFYRVRRGKRWQKSFYGILQHEKSRNPDFRKVLLDLQKKTKRVETSFASKLVATINPRLPIIDRVVLKNIREMGNPEIKLPYPKAKNRLDRIIELHKRLEKLFNDFLRTSEGKYLIIRNMKKLNADLKKEYIMKIGVKGVTRLYCL